MASFGCAALNLEAAKGVDRLGREAQVRADRNAAFHQHADGVAQPGAALHLDHLRTGLHQVCGVDHGSVRRGVAHEGHVGDDQGSGLGPADALGVVGHVVYGDGNGAVVALQYHAQ